MNNLTKNMFTSVGHLLTHPASHQAKLRHIRIICMSITQAQKCGFRQAVNSAETRSFPPASLNTTVRHVPWTLHRQYRASCSLHNCISSSNRATFTPKSYLLCTRTFTSDAPTPTKYQTVREAITHWIGTFDSSGIPEPSVSARYIIAHAVGLKQLHELTGSILCRTLRDDEKEAIEDLCKKRLQRMPVQYIIGEWDFRDLTLVMKPPVFIPSPETELLVELVLEHYSSSEDLHFLEIGCGSGAISISLLTELPKARMSVVEQGKEACMLTAHNAQRQGVSDRFTIHHSEFGTSLPICLQGCSFDAIVSNPPYLSNRDLKRVDEELSRYTDHAAMDGGVDGLTVIKNICRQARHILTPNALIWMETDTYHAEMIDAWLRKETDTRLTFLKMFKDFTDRPRFCQLQLQ